MRQPVLLALVVLASDPATAHEWYDGTSDPVTSEDCCNFIDCHPISREQVERLGNGSYRYRPRNWLIPVDRVQPSQDSDFHVCEAPFSLDGPKATIPQHLRCFFAPPLLLN